MGETPNLAARLQEQAPPDSVVISPATYRLVTGFFECEDMGQRMLKGISSPSSLTGSCGKARIAAASRWRSEAD